MQKNIAIIALFALLLLGCDTSSQEPAPPAISEKTDFIRGADLSFLPEIEAAGTVFYDQNGQAKDVLSIFQENGCNAVRIRAWHTPTKPHSGTAEVVTLANRVRSKGMKVWLDIHYSDTWADPGQQAKPAAWAALDFAALQAAVYDYTKNLLAQVKPDMVQIGNETNNGFLWPTGNYGNSPAQFAELLRTGIRAARDHDPKMKVMVHHAGLSGAESYFKFMKTNQIDYDIMGLSYYPKWHGKSLDSLAAVMLRLVDANDKDVNVCEIAYPFTAGWNDNTGNIVGTDDLILPTYPATQEGQKAFLLRLRTLVEKNRRGMGFCYWAPDWVAFKGKNALDGSAWENQAQFDFQNKALPSMEVYKK